MLRAIARTDRRDLRIGPLLAWLMGQRRGGSWISTLDTAYAVAALTELALGEEAPRFAVRVNGKPVLVREGRARLAGPGLLRGGANRIEVVRTAGQGPLFASAVLRWRTGLGGAAPRSSGIDLRRRFERGVIEWGMWVWKPLRSGDQMRTGDELRVVLEARGSGAARYVLLECPIPAGTEPLAMSPPEHWSRRWGDRFDRVELRDDRVVAAAASLERHWPVRLSFRLRAVLPGTYHVLPATGFAMYAPTVRGRSRAFILRVSDG